jgi:integrase
MKSKINCAHEWEEVDNRLICKLCGKERLKRIKIDDDLSYGVKKNGLKYIIRKNRNEYFLPQDWKKFMNSIPDHHIYKLLFEFLIVTGARIDEALHFKKTDLIDRDRLKIRLRVTKRKAKVFEESEEGKPRTFKITKSLYRKLEKINSLYIFLDINENMSLEESKKITFKKSCNVRDYLKRHLRKIGVNEKLYSLHNIRKTCGMWLKALGEKESEICLRLGHNADTFRKHYGSSNSFDSRDRKEIDKLIGEVLS